MKQYQETEEEFNEWYFWIREKNIENFEESTQNFYIAYENDKPVSVLLCIYIRRQVTYVAGLGILGANALTYFFLVYSKNLKYNRL
jgi:hypothetical protein